MSAPATAGSAAESTPNLLHVQFKNPEFLSYLTHLQSTTPSLSKTADPSHPLTEHNIMAYFATSPFFDRRSNNEQIRMQNIANGIQNLTGGMGARQEEEELKRFTGLEFVLVHAKGGCFVIQKRWRSGPSETTPLASYYVVNESIYQAPDLYSVLATRLQSTVYGLKTSLTTQRRARPSFDPRRGHHGRFIVPDPPTSSADTAAKALNDNEEEEEEAGDEAARGEDDEMELEDVTDAAPSAAPTAPQVKRARFD